MLYPHAFCHFTESTGFRTKRCFIYQKMVNQSLNEAGEKTDVRTGGAWFKRAGVTLLGRTLCRQSGRGASRAGSVHLSSKWLVGRRSADTQQAGTFRLSMNPRALYVPCVTCIFSSRSFLTLVLMSYNLCDNASMYFARQNSGWFNLDSMPS